MLYRVALNFESVDEIVNCDHLLNKMLAILTGGVVKVAQGGSNF